MYCLSANLWELMSSQVSALVRDFQIICMEIVLSLSWKWKWLEWIVIHYRVTDLTFCDTEFPELSQGRTIQVLLFRFGCENRFFNIQLTPLSCIDWTRKLALILVTDFWCPWNWTWLWVLTPNERVLAQPLRTTEKHKMRSSPTKTTKTKSVIGHPANRLIIIYWSYETLKIYIIPN